MTKSKISLLGSLFVAGALAAAGCGGGSSGGTGGKGDAGTGGKAPAALAAPAPAARPPAARVAAQPAVTGTGGKTDGGPDSTGTGGATDGRASRHGPVHHVVPDREVAQFAFDQGANLGWRPTYRRRRQLTTVSVGGSRPRERSAPARSHCTVHFTAPGTPGRSSHSPTATAPPPTGPGYSEGRTSWVKLVTARHTHAMLQRCAALSFSRHSSTTATARSASTGHSTFSNGAWQSMVVEFLRHTDFRVSPRS